MFKPHYSILAHKADSSRLLQDEDFSPHLFGFSLLHDVDLDTIINQLKSQEDSLQQKANGASDAAQKDLFLALLVRIQLSKVRRASHWAPPPPI